MIKIFGATLLLSLREIRRHILRSFLTTLGIIIGVAAVITMVTLGNGVTASVRDSISSLGSNVYIIFPLQSDRGSVRPFDETDVAAVESQIAGVQVAAGSVSSGATAFHNGQDWQTSVEGVNGDFLTAQSIAVEEGRRFTQAEETAGQNVCLIGPKVRDAIFVPASSPVGETMRLDDVSCTVVGCWNRAGRAAAGR